MMAFSKADMELRRTKLNRAAIPRINLFLTHKQKEFNNTIRSTAKLLFGR
jgi:hypothetical protein